MPTPPKKTAAFPPGIATAHFRRGAQPLYLCLGVDCHETANILDLHSIKQSGHQGWRREDISWQYGQRALWLHAGTAMLPEGDLIWQPYLQKHVQALAAFRLGGIVCVLDAERLLSGERETIRNDAARLRMRIDEAAQIFGRRFPVYLLVSRIDALYGMKSLVADLPTARVEKPLGALRTEEDDPPGKFAVRIIRQTAMQLELAESSRAPVTPAAFHAPTELRRMAEPFGFFCEKAFLDNPYQTIGKLRGVFLCASERSARTLSPGNDTLKQLAPEKRRGTPFSWFLSETLATFLPADSDVAGIGPLKKNIGAAALLCGLFALCICLTCSFIEAKRVLERFEAGELSRPQLTARNAGWILPRFGMTEPVLLEERPAPANLTIARVQPHRPAPPPPAAEPENPLQKQWIDTVYLPAQLMGTEERLARLVNGGGLLEKFLTGPALGLWRMENGRLVALPGNHGKQTLAPEFLAYCNWAISQGKRSRPETIGIPVRIDSVSANSESGEKPTGMHMEWNDAKGKQTIRHQNFSVRDTLTWTLPTPPRLTLRVDFPAFSLTREYRDTASVRHVLEQLADGGIRLTAEEFPGQRQRLDRIGLTSLTIRSRIETPEELFDWLDFAEPELPERIIHTPPVDERPGTMPSWTGPKEESTDKILALTGRSLY